MKRQEGLMVLRRAYRTVAVSRLEQTQGKEIISESGMFDSVISLVLQFLVMIRLWA